MVKNFWLGIKNRDNKFIFSAFASTVPFSFYFDQAEYTIISDGFNGTNLEISTTESSILTCWFLNGRPLGDIGLWGNINYKNATYSFKLHLIGVSYSSYHPSNIPKVDYYNPAILTIGSVGNSVVTGHFKVNQIF